MVGRKRKKQGAALRAKRRADAAAKEIVESKASSVETARVTSKTDDELFALDTVPDSVHHLAVPKKDRKVDKDGKKLPKNRLSALDERKAKKLIAARGAEGVAKLASDGRIALAKRKRTKRVAGGARTDYDLWDDDEGVVAAGGTRVKTVIATRVSGVAAPAGISPVDVVLEGRAPGDGRILDSATSDASSRLRKTREAAEIARRKNHRPDAVKVDRPLPGQSYRPDPEEHQDAIGEALAVELRRDEVKEYNNAPIGGGGLSEETKAVLLGSDDEHDDDGDEGSDDDRDDAGEGGKEGSFRPRKKAEKLTRAQRNKQKRLKAERYALAKRKKDRRMLASVGEARRYAKELNRTEIKLAEKRDVVAQLKAERNASSVPGRDVHKSSSRADPLRAPAMPVALTEELLGGEGGGGGGGLRTVKPKGSLITDRVESMRARGMVGTKVYEKKLRAGGKRRKLMKGAKEEYVVF